MKKSIFLSMALILLLVTGCMNKTKTLVCTKDIGTSSIDMTQSINIKFIDDKVEDMTTTINVNLPDNYKSYINTFKTTLEKEYKSKYDLLFKQREMLLKSLDVEDEKIDYIGRSCIGLVVCKLHKGRATHTFCYSCTIEGGIATGSVSSESGNRIVYRCVRRR